MFLLVNTVTTRVERPRERRLHLCKQEQRPILPDPSTLPVTTSPGGSGPKEYQGAQTAQTAQAHIRQSPTLTHPYALYRSLALWDTLPVSPRRGTQASDSSARAGAPLPLQRLQT